MAEYGAIMASKKSSLLLLQWFCDVQLTGLHVLLLLLLLLGGSAGSLWKFPLGVPFGSSLLQVASCALSPLLLILPGKDSTPLTPLYWPLPLPVFSFQESCGGPYRENNIQFISAWEIIAYFVNDGLSYMAVSWVQRLHSLAQRKCSGLCCDEGCMGIRRKASEGSTALGELQQRSTAQAPSFIAPQEIRSKALCHMRHSKFQSLEPHTNGPHIPTSLTYNTFNQQ